jgi:hypothetical protein
MKAIVAATMKRRRKNYRRQKEAICGGWNRLKK